MNFRFTDLIPSDWSRAEQYDDDEDAFLNDAELTSPFHYVSKLTVVTTSNNNNIQTEQQQQQSEQTACDYLIIGVHQAGSTFIQTLVQQQQHEKHEKHEKTQTNEKREESAHDNAIKFELIATVEEPVSDYDIFGVESSSKQSKTTIIAHIYRTLIVDAVSASEKSIVWVKMNRTIHDKHANWFSMLLNDHFHVQHLVIILDSIKVFQYRADDIPSVPHVTCLQTSMDKETTDQVKNDHNDEEKRENQKHHQNRSGLKYLPCPNLMSGVTAAVLSDREMRHGRAIALVTLEENHALDVSSVAAFEKYVLPVIGVRYLGKRKGQFDYGSQLPKSSSSLYL